MRRAVTQRNAFNAETVHAIQRRQRQAGPEVCVAPEDDVAFAGKVAVWIGTPRTDHQIGEAVAIEIPGGGNGPPAHIVCINAVDAKAVVAVEFRKREAGSEARAAAE